MLINNKGNPQTWSGEHVGTVEFRWITHKGDVRATLQQRWGVTDTMSRELLVPTYRTVSYWKDVPCVDGGVFCVHCGFEASQVDKACVNCDQDVFI